MEHTKLSRTIDRKAVTRAVGVEDDLMALLRCIGLMPYEN
jgi:hypothetical protein